MDCRNDIVSICCRLYTGKMHQVFPFPNLNRQIRVHMKDALGIELLNDTKYGSKDTITLTRKLMGSSYNKQELFLHCSTIRFKHNGKWKEVCLFRCSDV